MLCLTSPMTWPTRRQSPTSALHYLADEACSPGSAGASSARGRKVGTEIRIELSFIEVPNIYVEEFFAHARKSDESSTLAAELN